MQIHDKSIRTLAPRWHERRSGLTHLKWFENLGDLHDLTLAWIADLKIERTEDALSRGLSKKALDNVWMLQSIRQTRLDDILDDTSPDEVLKRLDHTVWAVQATTLTQIQSNDSTALQALLEQTAFRFGQNLAESRWGDWALIGNASADLALEALSDSPFSGRVELPGFLVRRSLPSEFQFHWRSCPHTRTDPEVAGLATLLCDLHFQALRGFTYRMNPRLELTLRRPPAHTHGECIILCHAHLAR